MDEPAGSVPAVDPLGDMDGVGPIWLDEADVVALVDLADAVEAVEAGLRLESAGEARSMEKTHVLWGGGHTLHALGAVFETRDLVATKTWAHTAGGATPLLVMWHASSGRLVAIVEAFALGQLRTGAMSGVATRWLARPDATTLAVIGSGKQALAQVAAVVAVRPIETVVVHSPTVAHRDSMADALRVARPDLRVATAGSPAEAVADAHIVTTVTRARDPFLTATMLQPGAHVNAVGAISRERAELAPDVAALAEVVAVDNEPAARRLAREVDAIEYLVPLSSIVGGAAYDLRGGERVEGPRPGGTELSVFKAMGTGLADLAVGVEILDRARVAGRGRALTHPGRVAPRLWRSPT